MDCFCLKTHHFMLNDDTIKVNIWDNNKIENNTLRQMNFVTLNSKAFKYVS